MSRNIRKKAKNGFKIEFFKLMNSAVFKKNGKCEKKRDIKLITTEKRRNYLVSKPNYHVTNFFSENILAI